jgi:hypothetical protein
MAAISADGNGRMSEAEPTQLSETQFPGDANIGSQAEGANYLELFRRNTPQNLAAGPRNAKRT